MLEQEYKGQDPFLGKLSQEELAIIRNCNKEANTKRGLPLAIIGGLGTFWAAKNGYIKMASNKHTIVLCSITSFAAFMVGRFSYVITCLRNTLPPSTISRLSNQSAALRGYNQEQQFNRNILENIPDEEQVVDEKDVRRSNGANENSNHFSNSYDNIREQNRKEFNDRSRQRQKSEVTPNQESTNYFWDSPRYESNSGDYRNDDQLSHHYEEEKPKMRHKNKYGDDFE